MKNVAQYLLVQVVIGMVQIMPIEMCARLCRFLSWLIADKIGFRRKVIRDNILGVYPDATDERIAYLTRCLLYTSDAADE